ncbi:MAG: hypothetical protein U0990_05975 [Candidatus Nanopelagicales bacterium]|nr:hypothetical protein [Candidatus Nanopelagicales bacterium]MDZ4249620.1 hypothetical protein [Candidatus Nanopelagicales bacterium]
MATLHRHTEDDLHAMRREVESRYSLRDLLDLSQIRPLTSDERDALLELKKIAFLLGEDVPPDE